MCGGKFVYHIRIQQSQNYKNCPEFEHKDIPPASVELV